ncbi:MAG: class I SAM-dependent DNA methyltransferase [Bacteroidia bacterium]
MKTKSREPDKEPRARTIQSFKSVFDKAAYGNSYEQTFDDFLTICICCFTRNFKTGLSHYEDEYLRVIEPYKALGTLKYLPILLAELILYMEENMDNSQGNDLLGTFFEQEISRGRNGQFFTPFHVCQLMTQLTRGEETKSMRVLDPCCGSGRMLLAFEKGSKCKHAYYGIDIDPRCVKMTAINLFLNGQCGEVVCGDALAHNDFKFGYEISILSLGIFKIVEMETSTIWKSQRTTNSTSNPHEQKKPPQSQLELF